jgi:phage-related protein
MSTVEINFTGKDNASGTIKTVKGELGDLGKEADAADKKSSGLFSTLGGFAKLGGAALLGGATLAIGALSGALIGGYGDAKAAAIIFAQTEAVIKSTGGAAGVSAQHVTDFASALSDAAGKSLFGDDQIAESTNLLLTFTNIKGTVLDAATAISVDMAQALGGAPADAAVQLGKALNDPIAGISALSRVGVTFSDDQKAVIQSMMDTGNVAGAQQVIIAELNKEFGGSAAAAAAAEGGMAQFKAQLGETAEGMMTQLLPAINQFTTWLASPVVMDAITAIGTGLVNAILAAATGFSTFLAAMQPVIGFISDNLTAILAALAAMLITVVVPAFIAWATAAGAAAIATITALAPVLIPIAAIGAAVGLLVTAWDRDWGGMRTTITAWWNTSVQPILDTVKQWLDVHLPVAVAALKAAWDVAWAAIQVAVSTVYTWLQATVWPWITAAFALLTDTVLPALSTAFGTAWSAISTAVSTVYTYFSGTVWPWLQTATTNIGIWIGIARDAWSTAWTAISGAVTTAKNTIITVIDNIKAAVRTAIDMINTLIDLINHIPGVDIPTVPGGNTGKSLGNPRTPLGMPPTTSASASRITTINLTINNPRNADDVSIGLQQALQAAGLA